MGKSVRPAVPKQQDPLQPNDFFGQFDTVPNTFGNTTVRETTRELGAFNPKEYTDLTNPTPYDDRSTLNVLDAAEQSYSEQAISGLNQLGANFLSGLGQGLANLVDVSSWGNDNYQSSLFGLSTKEMSDWARGIAERNKIKRENPGEFDPGSFGWWMEQVGSAGTGLGMGAFALAETAAIEYLTGGTGSGAAIARLGKLFDAIRKTRGTNAVLEAARAAKDLRSAATLYGVLNRTNESRMEGMMSYDEIYNQMSQQKNPDGTAKYTRAELENLAAAGADKTFWGNMALLPLDILAFRTMVYNPISGSATGLIESGLSKVGNKALRKTIQYATGAFLEGAEEGFQFVASEEGKQYAKVLGGQDDGSNFIQRLGADISSDEFWNNFAGGVIGSPIIGGAMNLANKAITGNRTAKLNSIHADYVKNIGKMDNAIANKIKQYQEKGENDKADILRRQFRANKALSALHLDAMTDKNTAFEAHINFLQGALDEVGAGETKMFEDLGFPNPTQEQIDYIKTSFQESLNDAQQLKGIYENVKDKYNKNFVPEIANDHFQLLKLMEADTKVNQEIVTRQGELNNYGSLLNQYGVLSTNGKKIYDSEYQLTALQYELDRLTEQYRVTKDEQEKANVDNVITEVKNKITDIKETLDNISKDEHYTSKQRNEDNDILISALKDTEYTQLMKDKEHISNAISLQRKNLSLWNNPQYVAKKTTENIKKARTPEQVESISQQNQNEEIKEAAVDKQNAIAAEEAAQVVQQEQDTNKEADDQIGNSNLFEEDSNLINNIKSGAIGKSKPVDDENQYQDAEEQFLLSPTDFDFENSSQEAKDKIISGVKGLVDRLQGEPNFENLVRHVAKVQGMDVADSIYNALKYGWLSAGFNATDFDYVYNRIFGNPIDDILAGTKGLTIKTTSQLKEVTNEITDNVVAKDQQPEFDNNNQPVYIYKGVVTNEASPKFAFVTRLSEIMHTTDDNGNIVVSNEYTQDELNTGDYVDSLPLLDPDKYTEGTEMSVEIPSNFNDIKIPVYNSDGTKGQSVTFGQYVAQKGLTPQMREYQDKVPMIIYRKGHRVDEKGVAFVHDIGWYHPLRFHQEYQDSMETAINHTRKIRENVLSNNGKAPIIITGKRQTTFSGLKTKPDEIVSLREANPDTQLTVALTTDSLSTSKTDRIFPNDNTVLVNNSPFGVGQVFEVRRYGIKDSKKSYIALPIIRPKLDDVSKSSVLQAINIYANRSNQNPELRTKHEPIVKYIQQTMGLDILSSQGLERYLQHFITTFNTEKASTNEHVEQQAKAKLASGTPYIAFIAGGNIVIGKAGEAAYVDSRTQVKKYSYFINPNVATPSGMAINNLAKPGMINWYEQNVNLDALNRNKPVVVIDKTLQTSIAGNSYKDFLLDRLKTNIKSFNIGTPEKPNYVTNIQPVITYDLTTNLRNIETPSEQFREQQEGRISETQTERNDTKGDTGNKSVEDLEREILEQAKRDLGNDFGIKTDLFSPAELSKEQREAIARSINRIAGLTPDQQFDIVDFMYNQIAAMVNLDNKQMSKVEVDKQVTQAFNDVVLPLKQSYQDKIKDLQQKIEQHPALKNTQIPDAIRGYEYRINKIEAVEASMNILKEEAYNRVAKYTGITENKVLTEKLNDESSTEENPDTNMEDEPVKGERDFWTDILQENPESRLSYSMRRFFGGIREYDKNGNLINGFLGLSTYTGADEVARTLMVTLADIPSDFDTMINKLEKVKAGIPWMQEVINKLKGATNQQKQQFVTVMSNTLLRMKFTMIMFDRRTNSWATKVWDTHLNGVADAVKREWYSNFKDSNLTLQDEEGNLKLNDAKAKSLISIFEGWTGKMLPEVQSGMAAYRPEIDRVKIDRPVIINAAGTLINELRENIKTSSDRMRFSMKNFDYQISLVGEGKYQIEFLKENVATKESVDAWLREFGINLSDKTLDELMTRGLLHNFKQRKPNELFDGNANTNGLFGILYNSLRNLVNKPDVNFTEEGNSPLDNSVINSLANLEAKYNTTNTPFGFRDNGKSFFALTAPKFITDRVRDLKSNDETVRKQLESISFSSNSMWLHLLNQDETFRDKFGVAHIGANAFKELGKKLYKDNAITKLADIDHELTKLGMFWDTKQGEILHNTGLYPGTNVQMRVGTMFSPTMSDKHLMTLITTAVLNLRNAELNNGAAINDDVLRVIYEQTIKPELRRMVKFYQNGGTTNIAGYDKGAGLFLLMPAINSIEYSPGLKLIDAIKHQPHHFTDKFIEGNNELMKKINNAINEYVNRLTNNKLEVWKRNEILITDAEGNITELKFFDKKYKERFRGNNNEIARMAAMDYVINYMISNANSFMTMAGDPAIYFKSKSKDNLIKSKDTFINIGKRLANQIAPGTSLSNSEHEKYVQIFIQDRVSVSENIDYLEKLLGKDAAGSYREIEGSDAQEYTTWKEHLDILAKLGKTPDSLIDITPEEITEARELFSSDVTRSQMSEKQKQLLTKVMQPIKPVYTGQIYDPVQDVMRTVYVKSSSFPLIPQLTAGMEIDKLRESIEQLERKTGLNVRVSYQTANKVGSVTNPAKIWKDDGTIDEDGLKSVQQSSLILDRKNFRIQQEVPFKSSKKKEDKITLGTQLMKLLFGDEIMYYDGFKYNNHEYNGKDLHKIYNDLFIDLVQEKRKQLYDELGMDANGVPINTKDSMTKLQKLLKEEAVNRGYPLQDIAGLTLTKNWEFNLPLWASANSNRYESMLNAIITNRIIRMKFPGNSFVVGSEEGFRMREDLEGLDKSKIIWTSAWNGKNLQASYTRNGELHKAQVLVASKFKNAEGELINLFEKVDGEYKYITKTDKGFYLKEGMISKELLSMVTFRIPTSGHQSASQVEIAGFLPMESADLMIVPRNFTKQKGLDFDVDKENAYILWSYMTDEGKFEVLSEKHRAEVLSKADKAFKEKSSTAIESLFGALFGDLSQVEIEEYTAEDIAADKKLAKLNSKINEKLLQNKLIKINHAVMGANIPQVQAKINKTLNTDYAEAQATYIDNLISSSRDESFWTPLSDEYQKQKMMAGASGKIGTGAYSLDVVFHSLAQQAAINGKPVELIETIDEGEGQASKKPKIWRFGRVSSNSILGGTSTVDSSRTISDVMTERQNVAVDNEKLQIMGRVNLNDITMDVDKVMNMIGLDKGKDGNSISFLFLSQPIVRKFVERMKNANSNVAKYDPNKEANTIDTLIKEYEGDEQVEVNEEYWEAMSDQMTNENFITALQVEKPDGKLQAAILRRFIEMRRYGIAIRGIQTGINTDSKGLGKSFFDVIEKRNTLNRLGYDTNMIVGTSGLIGDYIPKDTLDSTQMYELTKMGYIDIGDNMVKPETLSGGFNVIGVATAYNMWNKFFPYDTVITNKAFGEVLTIIGGDNMGEAKIIELKQEVFRGMKKYFAASRFTGIIQQSDDINEERRRLFIDSEGTSETISDISFEEETSSGYRERTIKNASADATIAIATDFQSAGEKLTKSSVLKQNKKYISVGILYELKVTDELISRIVDELNSVSAQTLNIAGNGIYTMKGKYSQSQIDEFTYQLLDQVINSPNLKNRIVSIRSGGQTGVDEAGAKAGLRLGIPTKILAPKGWTFRNINGVDISDEEQFKARFPKSKTTAKVGGNTSLAKYLKTIKSMTGNEVVNTFINTNKLINRFEFDINKNGQPSLIKFNNASGEEFDEQYLYESLSTLMEVRGKTGSVQLPEVGNKKYTLDTLAQDLIAYCYLGNAIQEAIQFTKYVPVSYLNQVGFSDKMRATNNWLQDNPNVLGIKIGNDQTPHIVSEFTMQYIQHNPEKVKYKLDKSELAARTIKMKGEDSFQLKGEDKPIFISVYDPSVPKGEKKFKLYWFDGNKYTRVPVLGTFGMDEYQVRNQVGRSIVNGKVKIKAEPETIMKQDTPNETNSVNYNLETENGATILKAIADDQGSPYAPIAKHLLRFADNIVIKVADEAIINGRKATSFNGIYDTGSGIIYVHSNIINNPLTLADTIVHEIVHKLTYNVVEPHVSQNGNLAVTKSDAPAYVSSLVRLYNNLKFNVDNQKLKEVADKVGLQGLTFEEKSNYYGFTSIHEFMAMALTHRGFQEFLNKIEYKQTGMSFLDRFKQIILQVFEAVGLKFDEKYTAAHAISTIFEVIEQGNPKVQAQEENPYQAMYETAIDFDSMPPDNLADNEEGEPEGLFSASVKNYIDKINRLNPAQKIC